MRSVQRIIFLCVLFIVCLTLNIKAQSVSIDFKYDIIVKDSIIVKIKMLEGEGPYKYSIYQGSPFENGVLLKEKETSLKKGVIKVENKSNLYLCVATLLNGKRKAFKIVPLN
jgi:hypothetical protein